MFKKVIGLIFILGWVALLGQGASPGAETLDLNSLELEDGTIINGTIISERGDDEVAIRLVSGTILRFPAALVVNLDYRRLPKEQIKIPISNVVLLNDETVYKGIIVQNNEAGVKVKTASSSIFSFKPDEIKKIISSTESIQEEDVRFFSLAEREEIFLRDKKELWLSILLDIFVPGGGYYYLWAGGQNYLNSIGDTLYADILLTSFTISLSGFSLYLGLDGFMNGPISGLSGDTQSLIAYLVYPIYFIVKGIELWQVIVRTINYNQYLREEILKLPGRENSWLDFIPKVHYISYAGLGGRMGELDELEDAGEFRVDFTLMKVRL